MYNHIVIFGQKENGKSTLAKMLKQHLEFPRDIHTPWKIWDIKGFATPGKQFVADVMRVDLNFLNTWKGNPDCPPGWKKPVRLVLQEAISYWREVDPHIWTKKAFQKSGIIDDGRFKDEFEYCKQTKAFTIFIYNPRKRNHDTHESEIWCGRCVDHLDTVGIATFALVSGFDIIIENNATLDALNSVAKLTAEHIQHKGNTSA